MSLHQEVPEHSSQLASNPHSAIVAAIYLHEQTEVDEKLVSRFGKQRRHRLNVGAILCIELGHTESPPFRLMSRQDMKWK